jgi:hypothetical protein
LSELRDKLAGTIRITAGEHSADTIFWPALAKLLTRCRAAATPTSSPSSTMA